MAKRKLKKVVKYCEDCGAKLIERLVPTRSVNDTLPRFSLDKGERMYLTEFICPEWEKESSHTRFAEVTTTLDGKLVYKTK